MTIKSALSVVALLSGVAFSGAAFAQTMVGNNDVSETDLPYVQQHCDALSLADMNSNVAGEDPLQPGNDENNQSGEEADTAARNTSTTVDLDTITLEDCVAAGLVAN
ncbi:MAG: hypothetical protein ABS75_16180 [Pelagibacterium sp. SCN 63-23]|nr:MAG: hypothetical protein ABS75_16180 [Pelagibacterium sp. SCN 63-23]